MRWTPGGTSDDIEDRRGDSDGGGGFNLGGTGLGLGGTVILLILSAIFGRDFLGLFSGSAPAPSRSAPAGRVAESAGERREVQFVSFVLDDAQRTWESVLPRQEGRSYRHAKLVLFRDAVQSACGMAESATGPFYCPGDEKVYLDLGFFEELRQRFGAPGEFAQAYVIAHEIGHHVQKILGIERRVRQLQGSSPGSRNTLSVRMELQADCLAGVWGYSTEQRKIIDEADVAAGLHAAASSGDDRLQRMAGRRVSPESFTHGSSAQRVEWFRRGLRKGEVSACNTFAKE
jgi:predicted metalloprotease